MTDYSIDGLIKIFAEHEKELDPNEESKKTGFSLPMALRAMCMGIKKTQDRLDLIERVDPEIRRFVQGYGYRIPDECE